MQLEAWLQLSFVCKKDVSQGTNGKLLKLGRPGIGPRLMTGDRPLGSKKPSSQFPQHKRKYTQFQCFLTHEAMMVE